MFAWCGLKRSAGPAVLLLLLQWAAASSHNFSFFSLPLTHFSHLRELQYLSWQLFAGSWALSVNSKDISHSLPTRSYSFTQIWDLALCDKQAIALECVCECAAGGVLRPWQTLLPPLREEWAAIETRTLVAFTTVQVKHRVRAKCRRALLPWKGPLSRVSFQVPAEREPTESCSQQVFVCQPVRVSLESSIFLFI